MHNRKLRKLAKNKKVQTKVKQMLTGKKTNKYGAGGHGMKKKKKFIFF